MLLLADENVPLKSYKFLKEKGYDIIHIGLEAEGIKDYEIINLSIDQDRIIITFDSDFGELVFKIGYKPKGVIFFRWKKFSPSEPGEYLHNLIESKSVQFKGFFTVIDDNQIRQKKI